MCGEDVIQQGYTCVGIPPYENWYLNFRDDYLVSYGQESEEEKEAYIADNVDRIEMLLSLLAIEARDRLGGPTDKKTLELFHEIFVNEGWDDSPNAHKFLRRVLPEGVDDETLKQAYAFEMLTELDQVVDRSEQKDIRELLD